MIKHYEVTRDMVITIDGLVHPVGTNVSADGLDADKLAALLSDGTLVEVNATDTGKTPPKEPHPEQVETVLTKVIAPTVKKGKGK